MLDAIEKIEVSLRTITSLVLGREDRWSYRDPSIFNSSFISNSATGRQDHAMWLQNFDEKFSTSPERYAVHFRSKYINSKPPIWTALEHTHFGQISKLIGGLKQSHSIEIAQHYGLSRGDTFKSWIQGIALVRNISAHHGRLWNRNLTHRIAIAPDIPSYRHVTRRDRVYSVAAAIQYMLIAMKDEDHWSQQLKHIIDIFPSSDLVSLESAGFPLDWQEQQLWNP